MYSNKTFANCSNKQSSLGLLPWLIGVALSACVLSLVLFNSIQQQSEAQRVKAEVRYTLDHHANKLDKIVGKASANLNAAPDARRTASAPCRAARA